MKSSYIKWFLVVLVLTGGAYFWFSHNSNGEEAKQAQQQQAAAMAMMSPEVEVVTLHAQPVTITKDLPGRTSALRVAEIRPQVNGIIMKRFFTEGTDVKTGQQLYQIDPAPYQAAHESARADLMKAQANIKSVQAKADRYGELVKIGGISKQEYDDVVASLEQSKANIAIAQAAVRTARINLDYTKVLSPISGRIGPSLVTEGALVTANQPAALATVQQFDKIYVDVMQSSEELMRLRRQFSQSHAKASKPTARLVIGGEVYGEEGEFQFSDATVNQTTGTVQLRIVFPNTNNLILPGLFVHARLSVGTDKTAILVPQKASVRNPDGSVNVWVVDAQNKVSVRPITVGDAVGDQWTVTNGLQEGERVIVEGVLKVQPGSTVRPVDASVTKDAAQQAPAMSQEEKDVQTEEQSKVEDQAPQEEAEVIADQDAKIIAPIEAPVADTVVEDADEIVSAPAIAEPSQDKPVVDAKPKPKANSTKAVAAPSMPAPISKSLSDIQSDAKDAAWEKTGE
jgi:membrane fusion protein (multidrug efflux system)